MNLTKANTHVLLTSQRVEACVTGLDVTYCELEHAVIRKLPIGSSCHSVDS